MKKVAIACAFIMLIFAGCSGGNSPTVEQMAANAQKEIERVYGEDSSIKVTAKARGSALVYTYQASQEVTSSAEEIAEGVEISKRYYDDILAEMHRQGVKNPSIVLEYLDKDGGMLYTREFK